MVEIYVHGVAPSSPHPGLAYLSSFLSLGHNQVDVLQVPLFGTATVTWRSWRWEGFKPALAMQASAMQAAGAALPAPQPCPTAKAAMPCGAAGPTSAPGKLCRAGLTGHAGTSLRCVGISG